MSLVPSIARTEISRFTHSLATRIVLLAIALVPLLYAGALTSANTDPTNRLRHVPAAVVNEDEPVSVTAGDGSKSTVALGRVVAAKLVGSSAPNNFDWTLTGAAQAEKGLKDGTYLAVLTLPRNFSANASSVGGDDAAKAAAATLHVTTNDGSNYISGNIAKSVTSAVTTTTASLVSQNYLTGLYGGFNRVHSSLLQAADGAGKATSGATKLASGAGELASGATKLDAGATKLSTGLGTLAANTPALAAGNAQVASSAKQSAAGTAKLNDGASQVATGSTAVASGAGSVAKGSSSTAAGARQLATGSHQLSSGLAKAENGAKGVAYGASALGGGIADANRGASALASAMAQLSAAVSGLPAQATTLDAGAQQVSSGAAALHTGLAGYVDSLRALSAQCAAAQASAQFCQQLDALVTAGSGLGDKSAALAGGAAQVASGTAEVKQSAPVLASGIASASTGASKLAAGTSKLADSSQQLTSGANQLASGATTLTQKSGELADGGDKLADASGQLAQGASDLAGGSTAVASGARSVASGTSTLASKAAASVPDAERLATGAARVNSGVQQAASGSSTLAAGNGKLASSSKQLSDGAGTLSSGLGVLTDKLDSGATLVPTYTAAQKKHLSAVAAQPVTSTTERLHAVGNYGDGLAPYFLGLALWVGAMSAYMILRALPARAVASNAPAWRVALAGYLPGAVMSVLQSAVMVGFVRLFIDVRPANLAGMFGVAVLASLAFMAINQALVAMFGTKGRFLSLILLVLQIASAGGTYPVQTAPRLWQALHPWLPLTYVVQSFRSMIAGGSLGIGIGWVVIAIWLVIGLLLTFLAAKKKRMWTVDRLHPSLSI